MLDAEIVSMVQSFRGKRTFDGEAAHFVGDVVECDVVHDDVFVECLHGALAERGVRECEQAVGERVDFEFGKNAALRIQQERERADPSWRFFTSFETMAFK